MDWLRALATVRAGEIIHASAPTGASLICLVKYATPTQLHTKTVTSQISLSFDRRTGIAYWGSQKAKCVIDSIARLPDDIFDVMMQINTKYSGDIWADESPEGLEKIKLSETEIKALIFIWDFYKENPLPRVES